MKRICILTATRAEYGLLKPIITKLLDVSEFDVRVAVTGAHLSPEFGLTYKEIEEDGIKIDKKIEMLLSSDTPTAISKSMGLAMIGFADYLEELKPDVLIVLGDRYETLAVCCVAMNQRIPIVHLYGGETTEGLIDESIRHAITKMSFLHFTSTENYRQRVIQLGENPSRVFNVGSLGIENIKRNLFMSKDELAKTIGLSLNKPYAVVTFHPVTLENKSSNHQIKELLKAISQHSEMNFIFTKGNSDAHGRVINLLIDEFVNKHDNCIAVTSLGIQKYLTAIKYSSMVIGNSSSGIIEVPTFKVPTINIGERQKGRIQAESIINCNPEYKSILNAIDCANSSNFRKKLQETMNPYEKDGTSLAIVSTIIKFLEEGKLDLKKKFYDIN